MATFAARPSTKPSPRKKVAGSTASQPGSELQISREEIAKRAYEKFAARGYQDGFDQQDWFDAEEELIAESRDRM